MSSPASGHSGAMGGRPLSEDPAEFDLGLESEEETKGERSSVGPFVVIYAGAGGVFAVFGGLGLLGRFNAFSGIPGVVALTVGIVVVVAGIVGLRSLGSGMVVRLRIDDTGLTFTRKNGKVLQTRWDDPQLRVNLDHFAGDPKEVLPTTDARYKRPYWVDVWTPRSRLIALETTLPEEAFVAILDRAERGGARASQSRVAFYWHSAPKSPGWLAFDNEGSVGKGRSLNGEVTRLRGRSAPVDP